MVRYDLNPQHHRTDEASRREHCSSAVEIVNSSQCKETAHSLRSDVTTNYSSSRKRFRTGLLTTTNAPSTANSPAAV